MINFILIILLVFERYFNYSIIKMKAILVKIVQVIDEKDK